MSRQSTQRSASQSWQPSRQKAQAWAREHAASQRVHGNPSPIWLQFPALSPYKEKKPLTAEGRERLSRLAAPRPAATPRPQTTPDGRRKQRRFAPQIGTMWNEEWLAKVCKHEELSANEVVQKYRLRNNNMKQIDAEKAAFRSMGICGHQVEAPLYCGKCWKQFCSACWETACSTAQESFEERAFDKKVEAFESVGAEDWQARALVRAMTPVDCRLYALRKPCTAPPRARKVVLDVDSDGDEGFAPEVQAKASVQQLQASKVKPPACRPYLARLAVPKAAKEFPEIPYLPGLKQSIPRLDEIADEEQLPYIMDDPSLLEGILSNLEATNKITKWQAHAVLRCAEPVFKRLS